jgi:uncharacterized Zn finger protein
MQEKSFKNILMAASICPKCGSGSFEVVEHTQLNAKFTLLFVQCLYCGTVVGVTNRVDTGKFIQQIAAALKINL